MRTSLHVIPSHRARRVSRALLRGDLPLFPSLETYGQMPRTVRKLARTKPLTSPGGYLHPLGFPLGLLACRRRSWIPPQSGWKTDEDSLGFPLGLSACPVCLHPLGFPLGLLACRRRSWIPPRSGWKTDEGSLVFPWAKLASTEKRMEN